MGRILQKLKGLGHFTRTAGSALGTGAHLEKLPMPLRNNAFNTFFSPENFSRAPPPGKCSKCLPRNFRGMHASAGPCCSQVEALAEEGEGKAQARREKGEGE